MNGLMLKLSLALGVLALLLAVCETPVELTEPADDATLSQRRAAAVAAPHLSLSPSTIGGPMAPQGNSDCDVETRSHNGGQVQTRSEACISEVEDKIYASGESDITFCPPGWDDLTHSVDLLLCRGSGLSCVNSAFAEQGFSGIAARASTSWDSEGGSFFASGLHKYQVQTGEPEETEEVFTGTDTIGGVGGL